MAPLAERARNHSHTQRPMRKGKHTAVHPPGRPHIAEAKKEGTQQLRSSTWMNLWKRLPFEKYAAGEFLPCDSIYIKCKSVEN